MFRFINSGLKQSVTTFPNSIYNSSNLHKKVNDDDKENQKLSLAVPLKYDQTMGIYRRQLDNPNTHFDHSLSIERRNLIIEFANSHLGFLHLRPFRLETVLGLQIPSLSDPKPVAVKTPHKISNNSPGKKSLNDRSADKRNADDPLKPGNAIQLNELGHELNTKACQAVEMDDFTTALKYWNCAASMNYPPAQFNLGAYFESKDNLVAAEKWYRLAIKNGDHPIAAYNLALILNNKLDDCLKGEIKELMTISANQGSTKALQCIECINRATR